MLAHPQPRPRLPRRQDDRARALRAKKAQAYVQRVHQADERGDADSLDLDTK